MRGRIAGGLFVAAAVACGALTETGTADRPDVDGGTSLGGDAATPDGSPGAPDSGCPGHTFCESFDDRLPDGGVDLSRWPTQINPTGLAVTAAGPTSPPFALWMFAGAQEPLVRSVLEAPLPPATDRVSCRFDARFLAGPDSLIRVFQLRFQSGGVSSFVMLYGGPNGFQLAIHEDLLDGGASNSTSNASGNLGQADRMVPIAINLVFGATTQATATLADSKQIVAETSRHGTPTTFGIDVGLTNNNLPDAGPVDIRLDTLTCDVQ